MEDEVLEGLIKTLETMAEAERLIGEFYESCGEFFQSESGFWFKLAEEEFLHADILIKLAKMITHKPYEYEPGKLPSMSALRTFISRLHSDRDRLNNSTLTIYNALLAAYLIEMTVIECNYTEVVRTTNMKCLDALENLAKATVRHQSKIKEKMQSFKKPGSAGQSQARR